jgi:hypothetical protein
VVTNQKQQTKKTLINDYRRYKLMEDTFLTIETKFGIRGRGLLIIPRLPLIYDHAFKQFEEEVIVIGLGGIRRSYKANFHSMHFNITRENQSAGGEIRLVLLLPEASINDVSENDKVIISGHAWMLIQEKLSGQKS